jgi:hypothetical protein
MTSDTGASAVETRPVQPARARGLDRVIGLARRLGFGRTLDVITFGLMSVQGLLLFLLMARGGFFVDDFVNLSMAQRSSFSRPYLMRLVFDHPEPGARALNWILIRIEPMNYAFFALVAAVGIAATSWVIYRILRLVFRPSLAMPVLAWLAGAIVIWLPPAMWWASAMELVPCALGSALACHATVRCYLGPRRIMWGILAGVWLIAALSCYERALVGAAVSMVFLPFAVCDKIGPRQVLAVVRRAWPAYLAITVVTLAYLIAYLSGDYVHPTSGYSSRDLVAMLWRSWAHSLVPGFLGGPLHWRLINGVYPIGQTPGWWIVIGQLVALVVLISGFRRLGWRSLRGWVMFVPIYLVAVTAVASARLATYGPEVGNEFRYVADLVPMTVLALGIALLRPTTTEAVTTESEAAELAPRSGRFGRKALLLAGGFLAVTAPIIAVSAIPASNDWGASPAKTYVANLRRTLDQADHGSRWSVYNTFVPNSIMPLHYAPYSSIEYMGQLVTGRQVPVNDPDSRLFVVNGKGLALPAAFRTASTVADHCFTRPHETVVLPLRHPVTQSRWFLTLHYTTSAPSSFRFAINAGSGFVDADALYKSYAARGSGSLILGLRRLPITQLRIKAAVPGACVSDVRIGIPVPAGG